jgi:hypothetical protein
VLELVLQGLYIGKSVGASQTASWAGRFGADDSAQIGSSQRQGSTTKELDVGDLAIMIILTAMSYLKIASNELFEHGMLCATNDKNLQ